MINLTDLWIAILVLVLIIVGFGVYVYAERKLAEAIELWSSHISRK